jgi:hypothetical protein
MKKTLLGLMTIVMMAVVCVGFSACGSDDDGDGGGGAVPSELIGTWKGSNGTWTFEYTFNADHTGSGSGWTGRGSTYEWRYTYTVSGNTIKCKGASVYVGFDGEVTTNDKFETTFTLTGSTLSGGQFQNVTFTKK